MLLETRDALSSELSSAASSISENADSVVEQLWITCGSAVSRSLELLWFVN